MKKNNGLIKDILEVIISVVVISFILLKFVIMPCEVNGRSMYPLLHDKDRAYSFRITRLFGVNRFDVCVIKTSDSDNNDRLLVKRVIGLPNETIEYKNNRLYINGIETPETFLIDAYTDDFKTVIGENEYFCLGDNREISKDSRYYGSFKAEQIIATNIFVLYPFENFGVKK